MMRDSYRIAHMLNVCHFPPGIYVITATMECIVVQTLAEVLENPSGYLGVIVVGIDVPKEEGAAACASTTPSFSPQDQCCQMRSLRQ